MRDLTREDCIHGTEEAQDSTWGDRNSSVIPSFHMEGANMIVEGGGESIALTAFDEIVLTVVVKVTLCPLWLIRQFYSTQTFGLLSDVSDVDEKINSMVHLGLIWKQPDVTGIYIRPTFALFTLFDEPKKSFADIPFNMLTHTICEAKVMFDIMSGHSDICKMERKRGFLMPWCSEWGFAPEETSGTNVLVEDDFRNPSQFYYRNAGKLDDINRKIQDQIVAGEAITEELKHFENFVLIKKVDNTGVTKQDYKFHIPDLIIPQPRDRGKPRSIAVEVELSDKRYGYEETMERYRDNNRYGSVYWLCRTSSITNHLRSAFKEVGGCGSTRVVLLPFKVPAPNQ